MDSRFALAVQRGVRICVTPRRYCQWRAVLAHLVVGVAVTEHDGGHAAEDVLRQVDAERVGDVVGLRALRAGDVDQRVAHDIVETELGLVARFLVLARGGDHVDRRVAHRVDVVAARDREAVQHALADQHRRALRDHAAAVVQVVHGLGAVVGQVDGLHRARGQGAADEADDGRRVLNCSHSRLPARPWRRANLRARCRRGPAGAPAIR